MSVMRQNRRNTILLGQDNNALAWLLIINAVVFIIINFIKIVYFLSYDTNMFAVQSFHQQILDWFSLPAGIGRFATRPWTILTYMFSHEGVWQLIGTLLWLWGFGYIFQDLTGNSKIIPVYLYGGFAGALLFMLVSNVVPQYAAATSSAVPLLGGGSAVMAVALATTTLAPGYRIFPMINGGIPLWVLTLIFVAIDYATIASSSGSYALAHLAGGAAGFLFVNQMQKGRDWSEWMIKSWNWISNLFNPEKKFKKRSLSQQNFYKATRKPFEKTPHITQQKLDEILDKINQEGYQSLSAEEKDFLKKASQEDI
ncbi:MAG TPA: rhomboid family intramembrane serine protease [Panacibacter sp.]|nr:rhomboid family intramembrane serine protease [Panacibacter sp.]